MVVGWNPTQPPCEEGQVLLPICVQVGLLWRLSTRSVWLRINEMI